MLENFRVPNTRGDHHLLFCDGKIIFQSENGEQGRTEINVGALRRVYDELYPDGTFREALYQSLAQSCLPLSLGVEPRAMAEQLRGNHVYAQHRTEDDLD
mgnify:FL=1